MLWAATVRLVRGADKTAERQLRTYIDARSANIEDFEPGNCPTVVMEFRNVGQTPAKNDIFGNPRLTRFRVKLTSDSVLYRNNTFETCEDGNDAE